MSETSPVTGVAGRYAAALFELSDEAGVLDRVEAQLGAIAQALSESADLRRLVGSPINSRDEQARAMAAICAAMEIDAPTSNLIALMAAKRRLFALPETIGAFNALLARRRGIVRAEVTSAKPLSDAQRAALEEKLREATGAKIALDLEVDETLIGGLVVKVGSRMIDTSIRAKLNQLQTAMKEAAL